MVKYTASDFFLIVVGLTRMAVTDEANTKNLDLEVSREQRDRDVEDLDLIAGHCETVGLPLSLDYTLRLGRQRKRQGSFTYRDRARGYNILRERIEDETNRLLLMRIPADRAVLYDHEQLFGQVVADAFPSAKFDICESGSSFACGRFTASVFHLMRVLELGLAAFASIFSISADHTNWQTIIDQIEKQVRDMPNAPTKTPDWKQKQEFYSQAANSFMFFKDAWRNYTAHARGKYVEHEADTILRNVRAFMQKLAEGGVKE